MILSNIDKIVTIPYTAMTQRDFINTYINEASIYLNSNGILALPFTVDPLVMYWNRDTFSAAGIATYPHYWSDFTSLNQSLTSKDQNGNVRKSAVAMGTFSNISHARELFGTLLMQIGNPVTTISGGKVVTTVSTGNNAIDPAAVLKFFSQFADPTNSNYCWNQGMLNDKAEFLSGELATYFGFASELQDLRTKNPNINFDVAPVPQIKTGGVKATYGQLYGFSILRSSSNANAAYQVLSMILGPQSISNLAQTMYLPSVRIDAMNNIASDPYLTIFNQAALISKTWMDVDPVQSNQILGNMVNYYTSGQKTATDAIQFTEGQYNLLLNGASQ